MEDSKIVDLYWQREERAVEESRQRYGGYCFSVAQGILDDPQDAEEVVADTWLRAWNSIPPERPRFLKQYLAKLTRNLALSLWRSHNARKRGSGQTELALEELGECVPSPETAHGRLEGQELKQSINAFLRAQPKRERNVFLRRYFYMEEISQIAQRYRLTENNVFQILSRTRRRLKTYLKREGYAI